MNTKPGTATFPDGECGLGKHHPDHILSSFASQGNRIENAGEASAIPVGPLFAQALDDALYDVDFEILEIPLNSNKLWELVSGK